MSVVFYTKADLIGSVVKDRRLHFSLRCIWWTVVICNAICISVSRSDGQREYCQRVRSERINFAHRNEIRRVVYRK